MARNPFTCRLLHGFDDPQLDGERWEELVTSSQTRSVFQTKGWQKAWWDSYGRGKLVLVLAERNGCPSALAPLFCDCGMLFFVGSGGSDYLDFLGDTSDDRVLVDMLTLARKEVANFVGFRFYHVPDGSQTGKRVQRVAQVLRLVCFEEESLFAPALDLRSQPEQALAAAQKKSLVRHERNFCKSGELIVEHLYTSAEIRPHLDAFCEQHVRRWSGTDSPSLFCSPDHRAFYQRLIERADSDRWLRFTRLTWNHEPIAYHFGFCYRGVYMWYKPSFEIELARRSPGEVLLRQLLLAAHDEGARVFDFGLGDEPFKRRFATCRNQVRTWGLYPPEVCRRDPSSEMRG